MSTTSFTSVASMWHHRVRSTPDSEAMTFKVDGVWTTIDWAQAGERVRTISDGLLGLGLLPEQRVAILANTSVEWILADIGTLCAGGATTTIYPSNTPEECRYILNDCEAVAIFCDDDQQVAKIIEVRENLPALKHIIVFSGTPNAEHGVLTLAELQAAGERHAEAHPDAYEAAWNAITPDRLATLIYTSGTTGQPKGVMLTHDAWVYVTEAIDKQGFITPADKQFLFLPLAHVFAKIMQVLFIRLGVPTVIDGSIPDLIDNLAYGRPTWMGAVPRVFEKAYAKIVSNAHEAGGMKLNIFNWAVGVGRKVSALRQQHKEPTGLLKLQYQMAERLVFNRVREVFGGRLRFLISGGAPLSPEIAEFFHACGILILEGYGMTESTAATCVNSPEDFIFGTVGRPVPGVSVKTAEDGEILISGRTVMRGYYNLPDQTAKTVDEDGWLHTGDLGSILDSGHVKITGRKKDLIITAGGKNIGPAHFQNKLKALSPWVSQVLMHGDRRNYCVALVTINEETVGRWARDSGVSFVDYADLAAKPEVKALVQADVDSINKTLPSYETVKKIHVCSQDWTVENGFLTPSMKVKRALVETRYAPQLDAFYGPS
ncbi:MAG: long-chain fatty acid--CoA ligase [Myxococcota bacterium]